MDCSFLRLRGVLPKSFVGFALTAVGSIVLADTVMEYQIIRSLNRTNAFLQYGSSLSSGAPQGNNKIYRSDEVFLIEKNKISDQSQTSIHYQKQRKSADCKSNQPTASQTSQTPVRAGNARGQSGQVPIINASTANAARIGTGCQGILVPAAREYSRLQIKI